MANKKFRFDSFATEFACKEEQPTSSHDDADSGIGESLQTVSCVTDVKSIEGTGGKLRI